MSNLFEDKNKTGATGAVTGVTSTLGNGVGGLLGTAGGVLGATGRGRTYTLYVSV